MQQTYPFISFGMDVATPLAQTALSIAATVSQLTLPAIPSDGGTLRLVVDGTSNIAWCYGTNANLTISNGCFQLGNTDITYTLPGGVSVISVIGSAASGTLRAMVGQGI